MAKQLTLPQIRLKIASYCAYQERSYKEVKTKLISLGCYGDDLNETMIWLVEENFLSEDRFCKAFVGGKFRVNDWGKKKIAFALKQFDVSERNINLAIKSEISDEDYLKTIEKLIAKKSKDYEDETPIVLKQKVINYLVQKGYEYEDIYEILDKD